MLQVNNQPNNSQVGMIIKETEAGPRCRMLVNKKGNANVVNKTPCLLILANVPLAKYSKLSLRLLEYKSNQKVRI